jgi:NADH-quinone oxidoreductase subunit J
LNASTVIFYIIAAVIIGGGILAVTSQKIFRAAIYLLFSLIGIAALYFYLNCEFIAAVQIVVYVGGIVVLIIFSIFLTHASGDEMQKPLLWRSIFAALATVLATALTLLFIHEHNFQSIAESGFTPSVKNIGLQLLSTTQYGFILPFEVVSMLLLAALIGCIVIAIKIKTKE